jgi:hypothetical protein
MDIAEDPEEHPIRRMIERIVRVAAWLLQPRETLMKSGASPCFVSRPRTINFNRGCTAIGTFWWSNTIDIHFRSAGSRKPRPFSLFDLKVRTYDSIARVLENQCVNHPSCPLHE